MTSDAKEISTVVPRPVVVMIVLALTAFLGADVIGQFIVPGHTASPVLDGAILAVLGGVVAASRGPKPPEPAAPAQDQDPPTVELAHEPDRRSPGRHRGFEDQP